MWYTKEGMDKLMQQSFEFAESLAIEHASVPKTYILKVDDFDRANVTFDGKELVCGIKHLLSYPHLPEW
jgi:hypothetical protein